VQEANLHVTGGAEKRVKVLVSMSTSLSLRQVLVGCHVDKWVENPQGSEHGCGIAAGVALTKGRGCGTLAVPFEVATVLGGINADSCDGDET